MSKTEGSKHSIKQLLIIQTITIFVVIGIIITLGAMLVFHVMGTEYTQATVIGFIATVYICFIILQPAATLFAARVELIKEKAEVKEEEKKGNPVPVESPWSQTAPSGALAALLCITAVAVIVYAADWKPSPIATAILAQLFIIPFFIIIKINMPKDLLNLQTAGPWSGTPVASKTRYFWYAYMFPNLALQFMINGALANRGFSHAAEKLQGRIPELAGMVPTVMIGGDLGITFMFVCNFSFLATCTYVVSDIYLARYSYEGKARGIHGFLYFIIMFLMGIPIIVLFTIITNALNIDYVSFPVAMICKFLLVFIAVYTGTRLSVGWTGKRMNDAAAETMEAG